MAMDARRRTVLTAGAAGAAAALTGCGDSGNEGDGTTPQKAAETPAETPAGTPPGAATGAPAGPALARTADIPVGGGKVFADEKVVVTQPTAGEFKAFSAICTHQGCPVRTVEDGAINCPCHNSSFRIDDASVTAGPATEPLPVKQITVSGDTIRLV
jgi:Rieske Fe-S protein